MLLYRYGGVPRPIMTKQFDPIVIGGLAIAMAGWVIAQP